MLRQVIFGLFIVFATLNEGFGLNCLQCQSKDVGGRCRRGQRNHHSAQKRRTCYGKTAMCYALATVSETGDPSFERGCTTQKICDEKDNLDIEFCFTCQSKFCNFNVMELDKEVEDYLNEVLEYEKSLLPTTTTTTTTTQSPSIKPKKRRRPHVFNPHHNITSKYDHVSQDSGYNDSQSENINNFEKSSTEATISIHAEKSRHLNSRKPVKKDNREVSTSESIDVSNKRNTDETFSNVTQGSHVNSEGLEQKDRIEVEHDRHHNSKKVVSDTIQKQEISTPASTETAKHVSNSRKLSSRPQDIHQIREHSEVI